MTNYERIQQMSLEGMARFLAEMQTEAVFSKSEWEQWLEMEVEG